MLDESGSDGAGHGACKHGARCQRRRVVRTRRDPMEHSELGPGTGHFRTLQDLASVTPFDSSRDTGQTSLSR